MPKFQGIIKQEDNFVTLDTHIRLPQDSEYDSSDDGKETSEDELNSDTVSNESDEVSPKTKKTTNKR